MPLTKKEVDGLLTDLLKYRDELKWADQNPDELRGKVKHEDLEWLKTRKEEAEKQIKSMEGRITGPIVRRFPQRFGGKEKAKKLEGVEVASPRTVTMPAEEPEIIEVKKGVLERINDSILQQADYFSAYTDLAKQELETLTMMKNIQEQQQAVYTSVREITYPPEGGERIIPKGTTVLDLWTGDVYLGDGSMGKLSDSLLNIGQLYARSIYIDSKKEFSVLLDGKSKHTIAVDDFFARTGVSCQRVEIELAEPASIKFWASTNPDAEIVESRPVIVSGIDTWYYLSTDAVAAGMYVEVSIYDVAANTRLKLQEVAITCSKSCIQRLDLCISTSGTTDYWRRRQYDIQGNWEFDHLVLSAGETLKVRYHNYAGESLYFTVELLGVYETV